LSVAFFMLTPEDLGVGVQIFEHLLRTLGKSKVGKSVSERLVLLGLLAGEAALS